MRLVTAILWGLAALMCPWAFAGSGAVRGVSSDHE